MQAQGNRSFLPGQSGDTLTLTQVIEVARRWWWLLAGGAVLGLGLATAWVVNEVPHYRATAVLRVGQAREAVTSGIEDPVGESNRYVNLLSSEVELMRSRSLIEQVVDSVGYRLRPEYEGSQARLLESVDVATDATADTLWLAYGDDGFSVRTRQTERSGSYGEPLEIGGVRFELGERPTVENAVWTVLSTPRAVDRLLADLHVTPRPETNIVDVSFDHPDPATAQRVVNTLVERYQAFDASIAQERARRRRVFLEEQLAQTDANLAQAETRLTAFRNRAQTYDAREELSSQQRNRFMMEIESEELDADRRMLRNMLERLENASGENRWEVLRTLVSSPRLADNAVVSQMYQRLSRYQTELDSLTSGRFRRAETNPDVQRLEELIDGAEEDLVSAIRSHLASLDARAEARQELASRVNEEMSQLPPQLAEEARLQQMVDTYRNMVEQLREQYQKAGMAEAVAVGQADIVDKAGLPYKPLSRMPAVKLALGLLMGLALGGGGAFVLEHQNESIRRREEVEELFELPLLGLIPRVELPEPADSKLILPPLEDSGNGRPAEPGPSDGRREGERSRLPLFSSDCTHAAEAYRMLRANLLFGESGKGIKSLMVTSTAPKEGKTLTAVHLAASLAEEGARVLLVDGDLWQGRIHEVADVPEAPGLAEMLIDDSAPNAVCSTGVPRLFLLPRGRIHPSPSSLTRSSEVRKVLSRFEEHVDVIIVDGPPVLATASGPALAAVMDGVLFVIRAGQTERDAVRVALKELQKVHARVVGAVLNDPNGVASAFSPEQDYYYTYART